MNFQKINTLVLLSLVLTCISTINTAANTADQKSKSIWTKIAGLFSYQSSTIDRARGIDVSGYKRCDKAVFIKPNSVRKCCYNDTGDRLEYIIDKNGENSLGKCLRITYKDELIKGASARPGLFSWGPDFPEAVETELKALLDEHNKNK